MAPCSKLRRSCMVWGRVRATTVAPRAAAAVPAASWLQASSGFMAETPSTFQLTGRSASSDMVERKSMSSSVKPLRQPATMSSTVVPSCWRTAAARRSISSRVAARDGTGWPSPSLCVWTCEVEKPSAPSTSAACSAASMASMSSGVGRATDGALAHHEPAQRRMADEEPGVHGDAAVEAADPFAEGAPVPGQVRRAARRGACPRPAPSSARCSRRAPVPWAPARSRSCRRAPWSRRGAGRGWRWRPRRAARRSGCAGRRSRGRRACRWRRSRCPPRPCRPRTRCRRSAPPRSRRRPGPAALRFRRRPSRREWPPSCRVLLFRRARPAHPHPLAGEGLHSLGPQLDAEPGLLPPAHRRVHVDG